jgi:hypothetical protein
MDPALIIVRRDTLRGDGSVDGTSPLLGALGEVRLVPSAHGSREFYRSPAELTTGPISDKGFNLESIRVDAPVTTPGVGATAKGAARGFEIQNEAGESPRIRFRAAPRREALDGIAPGEHPTK